MNMTVNINIEGREDMVLKYLLLDLNGTIAHRGNLIAGIEDVISKLNEDLEIFLISADTFGKASKIVEDLSITLHKINKGEKTNLNEAEQKAALVKELGPEKTVAIGNGMNDSLMLKNAALSFAILGREGLALETMMNADLVFPSPVDALNILLNPNSLRASLRV